MKRIKNFCTKAAFLFMTVGMLAACGGNDPSNESQPGNNPGNQSGNNFQTSGLYLGITSFNKELGRYPLGLLDKSNVNSYVDYISSLSTLNGTILYYAVEENLDYLATCKFPSDLTNISVITFTDGLDQGSSSYNDSYDSHEAYLAAIQKKMKAININGITVDAYSIGVRGNDVSDVEQFKKNLEALASTKENAMEVSNINEVNAKFQSIAASLYKKNVSQSITLSIPKPFKGTKERFTFDNVSDGEKSKCYIEGVYENETLTQVKYEGLVCSSGTTVKGVWNDVEKTIGFKFENITDAKGASLATTYLKQFEKSGSATTWQKNVEFDPSKATETTEEKKSAVVLLIMDCSSSLGSDFKDLQTAAKGFVNTLANGSSNNNGGYIDDGNNGGGNNGGYIDDGDNDGNGGNGGNNNQETADYYIKHPWGGGSWTWQPMTKREDFYYYYIGEWGGVGVNIGTTPNDATANWYPKNIIYSEFTPKDGDKVAFIYDALEDEVMIEWASLW